MSITTDSPSPVLDEENLLLTAREGYGYCPLQIGQVIGDHYQVVRKLGWGGSSSVWLAKDTSRSYECYLAVKVMTANATWGVMSEAAHEKSYEVDALDKLSSPELDENRAVDYCADFWESFGHESVHGLHYCMAFTPYSGTLRELQISLRPRHFPLSTVKSIVRQALIALGLLHQLEFIHTDVQSHNFMVDFDPLDVMPEPLSKRIGHYIRANPAETHPPLVVPPDRQHLGSLVTVKSQPLGNLGVERRLDKLRVLLADFGSAIPTDKTADGRPLETPLPSRAPEALLSQSISTGIDIWAVGCMAHTLLFDRQLFQLDPAQTPLEQDTTHLSQMAYYFGQFPSSMVSKDAEHRFFASDGTLRTGPNVTSSDAFERHLESTQALRGDMALSGQEASATVAFLRRCFALDPSRRATASELLQDRWFAP